MKTRLYLIRHCQTGGNKRHLFQGRLDADINEEGAAQLERLAERFRDIHPAAVYSSPLRRALRTAEAATRFNPLPIRQDTRLIEIDVGKWEGRLWDELAAACPEECRLWMEEPFRFRAPGGESMQEVYARMREALTDIAAAHPGEEAILVSHGCTIRNALCFVKGWPITQLNQVAWCDNTGVSVIEAEDGAFRLITENDRSHLPSPSSLTGGWWKSK